MTVPVRKKRRISYLSSHHIDEDTDTNDAPHRMPPSSTVRVCIPKELRSHCTESNYWSIPATTTATRCRRPRCRRTSSGSRGSTVNAGPILNEDPATTTTTTTTTTTLGVVTFSTSSRISRRVSTTTSTATTTTTSSSDDGGIRATIATVSGTGSGTTIIMGDDDGEVVDMVRRPRVLRSGAQVKNTRKKNKNGNGNNSTQEVVSREESESEPNASGPRPRSNTIGGSSRSADVDSEQDVVATINNDNDVDVCEHDEYNREEYAKKWRRISVNLVHKNYLFGGRKMRHLPQQIYP